MRARAGHGWGWEIAVGALAATAASASLPSTAWAVSADLSAQFRNVREFVTLVHPDGSRVDTTLTSSFWTQTLSVRHARRFGANTSVSSEFNWSDHYQVGSGYRDQSPAARLSVNDSRFGMLASYQPSRTRTSFTPVSGFLAPASTTNASEILSSQRLLVAGYLSLPRLPRLDLSWDRTHRDAFAYSPQQSSITRTARISHALGPVGLRAGYSDAARGTGPGGVRSPYQTAWDAQAGLGVAPRRDMNFSSQYSFSAVRRGEAGTFQDRTTNHGVSVGGGFRPRRDLSWDLAYAFRHNDLGGRQHLTTDVHDGTLGLTYTPMRLASMTLAGAVRSDPLIGRRNLSRALVGTARFGGRVRRGWNAEAGATHSWSWDRYRSGVTQDNLSAHTNVQVRRGLDVHADWQLSLSGVAGISGERDVTSSSIGFSAQPVRSFQLNATTGGYAAGPRLGHAVSRSRTRAIDALWRPVRTLTLQAGLAQSGAQPNNRPRTDTQRYDLRWNPSGSLQLSTVYTKSNVAQAGAYTSTLQGQESFATRLSLGLGRSVVVSGGLAVTDPGASRESRQYDVSMTKTFGR